MVRECGEMLELSFDELELVAGGRRAAAARAAEWVAKNWKKIASNASDVFDAISKALDGGGGDGSFEWDAAYDLPNNFA